MIALRPLLSTIFVTHKPVCDVCQSGIHANLPHHKRKKPEAGRMSDLGLFG
jgi:hypothetical protein